MAYVREETLDKFTDEELLQIVKKNLDDLGIAYEEGPGGFGDFLPLDPADVEPWKENERSYMLQTCPTGRGQYRVKAPADYYFGLTIGDGTSLAEAMGLAIEDEPEADAEDGFVLTAA